MEMAKRRLIRRSSLLGVCGVCATFWLLATFYLVEHVPQYFILSEHHNVQQKIQVTDGTTQLMFDEEYAESLTSQLGSHSHSIIFLKAFKVGGTTISSILTSYAFNRNLSLLAISHICERRAQAKPYRKVGEPGNNEVGEAGSRNGGTKNDSKSTHLLQNVRSARLSSKISKTKCAHIYGTNHPPVPCGNFSTVNSTFRTFCLPPLSFIMLREPKERLWSGYRHEAMLAGEQFPLDMFLNDNSIVKTPTNYLLYEGNETTESAIKLASSMNILFHHLYDESLVFMAMKAGLTLCDIMYVPCDKSNWEASKCNLNTTLNKTNADWQALARVAEKTGEQKFYDTLLVSQEKKLKSQEVAHLTTLYRRKKALAMKHCSGTEAIQQTINIIKGKKGVSRNKAGIYHYYRERTNPLDPMTVCLNRYCTSNLT